MERKTAGELLSNNLDKIYGYCYSRLYNKELAEDLTNDIICNVLQSIDRLKCDAAFYGFMWKIAENTLKKHIRNKAEVTEDYIEYNMGCYWNNPESDFIHDDDINILRRELSLLSKNYRDVAVAYYIQNKSCSDISAELNISTEMVKYYLFKGRRILKEGIEMTREFGEKSYNPGTFRVDFWGGNSNPYFKLFERKLPGNIVLAAYEKPMTLQELSIELGVSVTYLEEETEILLKHEILTQVNGKYRTNIIIFKKDYEKQISTQIKPIFTAAAAALTRSINLNMLTVKNSYFSKYDYDENRIKWTVANIILMAALNKANEYCTKIYGNYPLLSNGSFGFVYGYDNDYAYHHFNGIYGHCENKAKTAEFTAVNYRIIERCQKYQPTNWFAEIETICNAILNKSVSKTDDIAVKLIMDGYIKISENDIIPQFPIFNKSVLTKLLQEFENDIDDITECINGICKTAAKELKKYTPKNLQDKCEQLSFIHHQMDVIALIIEEMVNGGFLTIPNDRTNLCIYGIVNE